MSDFRVHYVKICQHHNHAVVEINVAPAQGLLQHNHCEWVDAGHSYTSIVSLSVMSDAPPTLYQLTPPVNLPAALDQQEIDYLTVQTDRLLVIFRKARRLSISKSGKELWRPLDG